MPAWALSFAHLTPHHRLSFMLSSSLLSELPNVQHGFGARSDRMDEIFAAYWRQRPIQRERHGTHIAIVVHKGQDCGEADGMLTGRAGLLLSIMTADCVPVLLARKDGREVAALHIGWRGAYDGMVRHFAQLLKQRGDHPGNWVAATGPAAGACCYEVSEELIRMFQARFDVPAALIARGSRHLNLPGLVTWQLEAEGFAAVSSAVECTICHRGHATGDDNSLSFHSYRRDLATRTANKDVQWSVIVMADEATQL
jgi:YfiH family protein